LAFHILFSTGGKTMAALAVVSISWYVIGVYMQSASSNHSHMNRKLIMEEEVLLLLT
jgi:hypothetical protein